MSTDTAKRSAMLILVFLSILYHSNSDAMTFYFDDNITDNLYINNSGTSGTFNINVQVPNNINYLMPYNITSAAITFTFSDNPGEQLRDLWPYTSYYTHDYDRYANPIYMSVGGQQYLVGYERYVHYYSRTQSHDYYNPEEAVRVYTEGLSSWGATGAYERNTSSTLLYEEYLKHNDLLGVDEYNYYYTYVYSHESGYGLGFSIVQDLTPKQITSLSIDGQIDFSVTAYLGDLVVMYLRQSRRLVKPWTAQSGCKPLAT